MVHIIHLPPVYLTYNVRKWEKNTNLTTAKYKPYHCYSVSCYVNQMLYILW